MLVKPTLIIDDITTIDREALKTAGIRAFIFDLDNTIMAPKAGVLEERIESWLAILQAEGFKLLVLTNNKKADYVKTAEQVLQIPVIGRADKPRTRNYRKALEILQLGPEQVAMVGDRPLTDIWVGQRMGSMTILVDPLIKSSEKFYIKVLRRMERMFVQS